MIKLVDDDYISGGVEERFAPWNEEAPTHVDTEVFIESTLTRYVDVVHEEGSTNREDMISELRDEYESQHYTLLELLNKLKEMCEDVLVGKLVSRNSDGSYNTRVIGDTRKKYEFIIEECKSWEGEEDYKLSL